MAESSWPTPDADPALDRVITDTQFEQLCVIAGPSAALYGATTQTDLVYGDSSGRQVKVRNGRYGTVRGFTWWSGTSDTTVAIGANSSGSTRIDLIVLRLDRSTWTVRVAVVAGTPGAGVAPAPTQTEGATGVYELPLAAVTVINGAATISAGQVAFLGVYTQNAGSGLRVASIAGLAYVPVVSGVEGPFVHVVDQRRLFLYNGATWDAAYARTRGVYHTTGTSTNISFTTTETPFARYDLVANVIAGRVYEVTVKAEIGSTVAGDHFELRYRDTTALTGALVLAIVMAVNQTLVQQPVHTALWIPSVTGTVTLRASAIRTTGSGTCQITARSGATNCTYVSYRDMSAAADFATA